ncbi:hypothetical protein CEXT_498181 [Caerostris extrusa]|uniref:Uncharacterized protein n=1 Tax=Caerostris extrusa TaxID=172846 RepID=A0AAV4NII5_CAEEX|nr:hypothetical protein CEXT_498181 [Caerostris extrusa]
MSSEQSSNEVDEEGRIVGWSEIKKKKMSDIYCEGIDTWIPIRSTKNGKPKGYLHIVAKIEPSKYYGVLKLEALKWFEKLREDLPPSIENRIEYLTEIIEHMKVFQVIADRIIKKVFPEILYTINDLNFISSFFIEQTILNTIKTVPNQCEDPKTFLFDASQKICSVISEMMIFSASKHISKVTEAKYKVKQKLALKMYAFIMDKKLWDEASQCMTLETFDVFLMDLGIAC